LPGAETLAVDLLVPGRKTGEVIAVKELGAYAQAIPLLDFLIEDGLETIALTPNQVIPIRVPSAERFLIHKIYTSQSRTSGDRDKIRKDLEQAAVFAAAIEDETPGRLADAIREAPAAAKPKLKRGALAVSRLLDGSHEEARDIFRKIASR
jgi:hypothetical protein